MSNILSQASDSYNKDIEDMVYSKKKDKPRPVSSTVSIDWERVLSDPPPNNSQITKIEIEEVLDASTAISENQKKLVAMVDKDPANLFKPFLERLGLEYPKEKYNKFWSVLRPIVMNLKWKFNRPRPNQLAPKYGLTVNVFQTKTTKTPSYPSGHTSYAAGVTALLSDMYPEYTSDFYKLTGIAGEARILGGVHYESDNNAAMVITSAIWEDVKYDLFPELYEGRA